MTTRERENGRENRRMPLGRGHRSTAWAWSPIALLATLSAGRASADSASDVNPSLPNVLILMDTSGSMSRMATPICNGGNCTNLPLQADGKTPTQPGMVISGSNAANRWATAVQVLGGTFSNFQLLDESRASGTTAAPSDFVQEFSLTYNSTQFSPYDADYNLDYYRILNSSCTIGTPYSHSTFASWWSPPASGSRYTVETTSFFAGFGFRAWNGTSLGPTLGPADPGTSTCNQTTFSKTDGLGVLDIYQNQARFALMTFDSQPDPGTGLNADNTDNGATGFQGLWSYFPGWDGAVGTGTPSYAWPDGCTVSTTHDSIHQFENGARNPAAPPWEGPLIPFSLDDNTTNLQTTNTAIKLALWSIRPYGATPIGPMMADAEYYLWDDPSGPLGDPTHDCRGDFIILITDGYPNQDLRPSCQHGGSAANAPVYYDPATPSSAPPGTCTAAGGCCPAKRPQDTAYELANPTAGQTPVQTFVIGFATSDDQGNAIDCSSTSTMGDPATYCQNSTLTPDQVPCCALQETAVMGTPPGSPAGKAFFANDENTLRTALTAAMSAAIRQTATTRTTPVFGTTAASTGTSVQYQFTSSFIPNPVSGWSGTLTRVTDTCQTPSGGGAQVPTLSSHPSDDFGADLAGTPPANRSYFSYQTSASNTNNQSTIRPNLSAPTDGIPLNPGKSLAWSGAAYGPGTTLLLPDIGLTEPNSSNPFCLVPPSSVGPTTPTYLSEADCVSKAMNYTLSQPATVTGTVTRGTPLADVYHANPVLVEPPNARLRDDSYTAFASAWSGRTPTLLVATNDGLLHGFEANVTDTTESQVEEFAFLPPAVLPLTPAAYGGTHLLLLDQSPVIQDVAFGSPTGTTPFGRTQTEAQAGTATWRTIALGGLTGGGNTPGGYYAIDVTSMGATVGGVTTPKLLWQLTDVGGRPLFGPNPAPPAIGTVYVNQGGVVLEVPVAFLPGGSGSSYPSAACQRYANSTTPASSNTWFQPRAETPCWSGPSTSFTVVRLYDGQIIRSFRNDPAGITGCTYGSTSAICRAETPAAASVAASSGGLTLSLVKDNNNKFAEIDSPISGAVALFPAATGTVTTRAFVGDFDGGIWKVDVSNSDPTQWTFALFQDAYNQASGDSSMYLTGQPVVTPPVLSTDAYGNVVVLYATGDQNNFSYSNTNYVYSLTDGEVTKFGGVTTPTMNWKLRLGNGVTTTGPLTLFNGGLYFTTYSPENPSGTTSVTAQCLSGNSTAWGVDYLQHDAGDPTVALPNAVLPSVPAVTPTPPIQCPGATGSSTYTNQIGSSYRCETPFAAGALVFGASITQGLTCASPSPPIELTDPFFTGQSANRALNSGVTPGTFQLSFLAGGKSLAGGASATLTPLVVQLATPSAISRVSSWAAIVE